jgi:hypothetical protein
MDEHMNNIEYENKTLVLLPGSFKPPHKGHWQMVLDHKDKADEVHIFISNTSKKYISERKISIGNLKKLAKLLNEVKKLNIPEMNEICQFFADNAETVNWNELKEKLDLLLTKEIPEELSKKIQNYISGLEETLFKSIRLTANGTEITPEVSLEIFEKYIKDYGLENKVFAHISTHPSPMLNAVGWVNAVCKGCTIYIGSTTTDENDTRADGINSLIKGFSYNPTNTIKLLPVAEKIQAARDIRKNINNISRDMFPANITDETYTKIKSLLQCESKFNTLYKQIIAECK